MKKEPIATRDSLLLHAAFLMVALLFVKGLFGSVEGQQGDCGCQKINKNQGTVYIQFEETQAPKNREGREKIVYLRIRNNTTCEVLLVSAGNYFRNVNGVWTAGVEDGEEVNVYYEIEAKKSRLKHYRVSQLIVVHLLPGRSCIFPVQSSYLKKANAICVPCRYAWEDSSVKGSSPRSEALFYASDLPRGWDK